MQGLWGLCLGTASRGGFGQREVLKIRSGEVACLPSSETGCLRTQLNIENQTLRHLGLDLCFLRGERERFVVRRRILSFGTHTHTWLLAPFSDFQRLLFLGSVL